MTALSWILLCVTFVNPIFTATAFLQDRYQSRFWHHLVIRPLIFPIVAPLFGMLEYFITTHGFLTSAWYVWLMTVYFNTSKVWMSLVV